MSSIPQNCTWVGGVSPAEGAKCMTDTIDPEKLEEDLKEAARAGFAVHPSLIFTAARAHLATLPRFKEVEVWHVEYAVPAGDGKWVPTVLSHDSEWKANSNATGLEGRGAKCIRVTGPHKQRVPA